MSRDNPFGIHHQSVWRERAASRAANPSLDNWIRGAALAFGCHRRNGHAVFRSGEIAEILGIPGEPLSSSSVSNAISGHQSHRIFLALNEVDPSSSMEAGMILPSFGEESIWTRQHNRELEDLHQRCESTRSPVTPRHYRALSATV